MSKPYQHHDADFHDIGKAEPKAKRPTQDSPKKQLVGHPVRVTEYDYLSGTSKHGHPYQVVRRRVPRAVDVKRAARRAKKGGGASS